MIPFALCDRLMQLSEDAMKQLHFQKSGRMLVATEGPFRFVLRQPTGLLTGKKHGGWKAEIYEREGRRTPRQEAQFASKAQAIDWLARYQKPEAESA